MKTLRDVLSTAVVLSTLSLFPFSVMLSGCGAEAVSEGETDPEEILEPSDAGKDASLIALGIDSQKRGASGNVTYLGGSVPLNTGSADEVRAFVRDRLAGTYELAPGTDFTLISEESSNVQGRRHRFVRMQQTVDGIAVTHGQLTAHIVDGTMVAMLGELKPRARGRASSGDGKALVRQALARDVSATDITVHDGPTAAVFVNSRGEARTAFRAIAEYRHPEGTALDEVFVDQESGQLIGRYTQIHSALDRQIYDLRGACITNGRNLPGNLVLSEGGTSTDSAATNAYNGVGNTYWFYKNC